MKVINFIYVGDTVKVVLKNNISLIVKISAVINSELHKDYANYYGTFTFNNDNTHVCLIGFLKEDDNLYFRGLRALSFYQPSYVNKEYNFNDDFEKIYQLTLLKREKEIYVWSDCETCCPVLYSNLKCLKDKCENFCNNVTKLILVGDVFEVKAKTTISKKIYLYKEKIIGVTEDNVIFIPIDSKENIDLTNKCLKSRCLDLYHTSIRPIKEVGIHIIEKNSIFISPSDYTHCQRCIYSDSNFCKNCKITLNNYNNIINFLSQKNINLFYHD